MSEKLISIVTQKMFQSYAVIWTIVDNVFLLTKLLCIIQA